MPSHQSGKRVLLLDVDGKQPNLALMKLSAWHKARGDEVGFTVNDPDIVYASVIFRKNKARAMGMVKLYPNAEIHVGGSGTEQYEIVLPTEVEAMVPDYGLYPGIDHSLGFTSRGCVRHCYFCIVPEKEGRYTPWQHPSQWVRHNKAKLLDNNWYANQDWFFETSEWLIQRKVAVDVTQGMDIRLLTDEIAQQLKRLKWWASPHFAFDDMSYKNEVIEGIDCLRRNGINPRNTIFLAYCHSPQQYEDCLARCRILLENGASPFVMKNQDVEMTKEVKDLAWLMNRPQTRWVKGILDNPVKVALMRKNMTIGRSQRT